MGTWRIHYTNLSLLYVFEIFHLKMSFGAEEGPCPGRPMAGVLEDTKFPVTHSSEATTTAPIPESTRGNSLAEQM